MGLLKRLLGGESAGQGERRPSAGVDADPRWLEDAERFGDIRVDVVGESHYQPAIRAACDWKPGIDTRFECMAELVPEPTNPHDSNAIMVRVEGRQVGYLSRADAVRLGPSIREAVGAQGVGMCRAFIAGRADGDTDNLGVFLHLDAEVI
jgi:HIRAN domain